MEIMLGTNIYNLDSSKQRTDLKLGAYQTEELALNIMQKIINSGAMVPIPTLTLRELAKQKDIAYTPYPDDFNSIDTVNWFVEEGYLTEQDIQGVPHLLATHKLMDVLSK